MILEDAAPLIRRVKLDRLLGQSILLTGASGLLGTYFLACLRQLPRSRGRSVKVFAVIRSEPQPYFTDLCRHPSIRLLQGDLTDSDFCRQLPKADYVIHAAGYGQPGRFLEDPVATLALNSFTTLALLEHVKPNGKFLFVSSSEVYSGLQGSPHAETEIGTTNTTHPRACYIEGKRCGEAICQAWRQRGLNAKAARLALAYGPGARRSDSRVLNHIIEQALNQGRIRLQDRGSAQRTYCYIADAVEILWRILLDGRDPIYNVGGRSRTTIADLARQIAGFLQVPLILPEQEQTLTGAPAGVELRMLKAEKEFKKRSYVSLAKGLQRTIAWQKAYRGLPQGDNA